MRGIAACSARASVAVVRRPIVVVGVGDDRGLVARRLRRQEGDDDELDVVRARVAESVGRCFEGDVVVVEIRAKAQNDVGEIGRRARESLLRHRLLEQLLELQLIVVMDLLEEILVQKILTLVADDRRAALIDEENLARLGMATAGELRGERVHRRDRPVGQIVDVRRTRVLDASNGDERHLTVGVRRRRMMIGSVVVRRRMVIVQVANVAADVHHFVEMPVDRRAQRCAVTTTQDRWIDERILMRWVESVVRSDTQPADERAF